MGVSPLFDIKSPTAKMKMFKRVKKRLGLGKGVSSGQNVTNNLPPLLFHEVHGGNIMISRDGTVARRIESFCKGVAFSDRPVKIAEKIYLKFVGVSNNWSGVLRFGFTNHDPSTMRYCLPKYACPDLTNKPGYWAKALAERLCEKDAVLFYYVTVAGDVHFGVNGEEKGVFFSGVDTRGQLWAMLDIYGNSTAVQFVDPRQNLNNTQRRRHTQQPQGNVGNQQRNSTQIVQHQDEVEQLILPQLAGLTVHQSTPHQHHNQQQPVVAVDAPEDATNFEDLPTPLPLRYQHPSMKFVPLPFHRTRGRNLRLSADRCIASRSETEFCQGYVFTGRPLALGEKIVVQVLATEPLYLGALAMGLTSCDPSTLGPNNLPDDADILLDRPEYWVVSKDVATGPLRGDELAFVITSSGEVQMSKNGGQPVTIMHVDQSLTLWAFFDVYGTTQAIRLLTSALPPVQHQSCGPASRAVVATPQERCCPVTVATAPSAGGGTVLVVNLPPPSQNAAQSNPYPPITHSSPHQPTYSPTYIEPVGGTSYSTLDPTADGIREWVETSINNSTLSSGGGPSDCSVCYERPVDSVLYTCGHMCMCFECSVQQWRGKGCGHCPICRAVIKDVIRTFKS
ncbi:E3 ubiquitin-protein ligase neur isoform X4 [Rhodnius prolixus]|uniref:E3 ubiquitin-protein ligase neur isoform X4 n=1 Tax=Rhodnius prolixus TaxID=13249 RepID=UPI003D18836F